MKKYKVIYADPPWSYKNKHTGGSMISGASSKYSTMSLEDICNLKIKEIADDSSVLFLWVTVPMLENGFKVLSAWGYKYKTMITWEKQGRLGMGYYFRGQTEHILVGVRGKIKAFRLQEPNIIKCRVLKHSEKPEEFRQLIERATKNLEPKIELFARKKVENWVTLGYGINDKDIKYELGEMK